MIRFQPQLGDAPEKHELECAELMRRIKIMEGKRITSHADEQRVISAQRSTIDKLRKSNKAMQEDLSQDSKVLAMTNSHTWLNQWLFDLAYLINRVTIAGGAECSEHRHAGSATGTSGEALQSFRCIPEKGR